MTAVVTRLRMQITSIEQVANSKGEIEQERVTLGCIVTGKEDSINAKWARWTPWGEMKFTISNPKAIGTLKVGQYYYVDLTETEKNAEDS